MLSKPKGEINLMDNGKINSIDCSNYALVEINLIDCDDYTLTEMWTLWKH